MKSFDPHTRDGRQKFYRSTEWRNLRAYLLGQNPICIKCNLKPANEVHHKIDIVYRPDLSLVPANLQCLCKECHSEITNDNKLEPYRIYNREWKLDDLLM